LISKVLHHYAKSCVVRHYILMNAVRAGARSAGVFEINLQNWFCYVAENALNALLFGRLHANLAECSVEDLRLWFDWLMIFFDCRYDVLVNLLPNREPFRWEKVPDLDIGIKPIVAPALRMARVGACATEMHGFVIGRFGSAS
jgi:hypothetical protein